MCAHLRSYTQNNAPFRALLGDPCLGEVAAPHLSEGGGAGSPATHLSPLFQLLSAVVQDEQQQLTLTLSFALAGQAGTQVGGRPGSWTASTSS